MSRSSSSSVGWVPSRMVSVANSHSCGARGFEKATAMLFPSEIAQRGRMSRTTFSAGVFALLVLRLIFVLFATTMSEFSSAMELLQIIPKALTSDTLHL